jgi:hypothetical protein
MAWVASIVWDLVSEPRETGAMMLFILEESAQTIGMGIYLAYKEERWEDVLELTTWAWDRVGSAGLNLATSAISNLMWPLNKSYEAFFRACRKHWKAMWIQAYTRKTGGPPSEETLRAVWGAEE